MYLDKISLKNIRGFENLKISLKRPDGSYAGWTVFTGDNGSGKSTLLKAVAVALVGRDTARTLQPSFQRWLREGTRWGSIELEIVRVAADDKFAHGWKGPVRPFEAVVGLRESGRDTVLEEGAPTDLAEVSTWSSESKGWFSCGYGPFRRVFGASPEATRQMVAESTARFVTMFQEAASLAEVDQWLRTLSHKALERRGDFRQQRDLVVQILRDELLPNEITVDRVDSDGLWLKDRNGLQMAWPEMSDRYRAALALLADILRHLIAEYGLKGLTKRHREGYTYVDRSGVVLIDEIDAHLHPEWQREIGFWLKKHFPKIQFLVTTHSPIICQAADPNGLFVLPEPGSGDAPRALTAAEYQEVIASRSDVILRSAAFGLQNTRSPRAVERRETYSELMSKKRSGAKLTAAEKKQERQLALFVAADGED